MSSSDRVVAEEPKVSLLEHTSSTQESKYKEVNDFANETTSGTLVHKVWIECKRLWDVAGPAIINCLASFSVLVITQSYVGHLGDLEFAGFSIATNVIVSFDFGLLLGMASALETLCGQAFGAKNYYMLGIYLQRSWMVLFTCCILLLPWFLFATPVLKLMGQPSDVAEIAGKVAFYFIPMHFSLAFQFPLQRYLQCQLKNAVIAWVSLGALVAHAFFMWFVVYKFQLGLIGAAFSYNMAWWLVVIGYFIYTVSGGCPLSWTGFSVEAFSGIWDFVKLSAASGVMLCLENWYYTILIVIAGTLKNAEVAIDALSICMSVNSWEMMIPLGFFAATGVRVANELGAGNGKGAKFATIVAVSTSLVIGLIFWLLIMVLHGKIALIFTSSKQVLAAVNTLYILLAFTVLLNSVQPILSGVAVGSGWQYYVAYLNLGCYYLIGLPLGVAMGWVFNQGVMGIWAGMVCGGTVVQTLILAAIVIRCDWEKEAQRAQTHVKMWEV